MKHLKLDGLALNVSAKIYLFFSRNLRCLNHTSCLQYERKQPLPHKSILPNITHKPFWNYQKKSVNITEYITNPISVPKLYKIRVFRVNPCSTIVLILEQRRGLTIGRSKRSSKPIRSTDGDVNTITDTQTNMCGRDCSCVCVFIGINTISRREGGLLSTN